ncbi:MAG: hypothetical protein ABIH24_04440 [Verrucomicrobiota bacterium]
MNNNVNIPRTTAVPRDRILDVPDSPVADHAQAKALFSEFHARSEKLYNGNGSWGHGCADPNVFPHIDTPCSRPMIRQTAWRVRGYLAAGTVLNDPIFRARAYAGCEHLVREQRPDGYFPYYLDDSGWPITDSDGIMYVTGIAVDALLDGYEAFHNPYFLQAAFRGCEWAMRYPHVSNTNYNSFCVLALARMAVILAAVPEELRPLKSFVWAWHESFRNMIKPDNEFVEYFISRAVYFTKEGVFPDQQPNGGWPGHNSWVWYHGIILLGHARLLCALTLLPCKHALLDLIQQPLKESTVAAINYLILNLTSNGDLYKNHESTEPGSPAWPFLAFCALPPQDVKNGKAIWRMFKLLSAAVVRHCAREKFDAFDLEKTKLPVDVLAGNMMAVGHVMKHLDGKDIPPA